MDRHTKIESINEVIHKKEAKKLKAKGLSPIDPLAHRTIGLGYHTSQAATEQASEDPLPDPLSAQVRTRNQRINFDIDSFLEQLIMAEMIDERFVPFYAKACHQLGLATVNRLQINALNGKNPQKLFAYKVKGALQSQAKREFESL
jgi:hypothetical protein